MQNTLNTLKNTALMAIEECKDLNTLDNSRTEFIGKKGKLTTILKDLKNVSPEDRPKLGALANVIKQDILSAIDTKRSQLEIETLNQTLQTDTTDATLPSYTLPLGKKHPINQTITLITDLFKDLGYSIKTGPDVETDFFNFQALNIPEDHPARDMHDTFYVKSGNVLRTHTSPVQVRTMQDQEPPIKIIVPGKVYRCDADVSHSPIFHQVEGLYVDQNVTFADLKGTLEHFLRAIFGAKKKVRFRPSYFPFTTPSTEVDVECVGCNGKGCGICKQTGWLEILGAGMVHENVFKASGYDPEKITGFAFGLGVERIAMLHYKIPDIRLFYENDCRFLNQF